MSAPDDAPEVMPALAAPEPRIRRRRKLASALRLALGGRIQPQPRDGLMRRYLAIASSRRVEVRDNDLAELIVRVLPEDTIPAEAIVAICAVLRPILAAEPGTQGVR